MADNMDMKGQSTTDIWTGFSTFIHESYSDSKQEFTNNDQSHQISSSLSLLLTVGGQEISQLFNASALSKDDISQFHLILSKVEELCLFKLILEYEKYKQSLQITKANYDKDFQILTNLGLANLDNCDSHDVSHEDSSSKTIIILTEMKNDETSGSTVVNGNENSPTEKDCVDLETSKEHIDNHGSKPVDFNSLCSSDNITDNFPCDKNTSKEKIATAEENVEASPIRRSSRQVRVSSRYAENKEAIKHLLKPPVKKATKRTNSTPESESHFLCPVCQKSFSNSKALKSHLKSHEQSSKDTNTNGEHHLTFLCKVCGSKYENLNQLKAHFRSHKQCRSESMEDKNDKHKSSVESVVTPHFDKNTNAVIKVDEQKESQDLPLPEAETVSKCSNCSQVFDSEEDLKIHKNSCASEGCGDNSKCEEMSVDKDSSLNPDSNIEQNANIDSGQLEDGQVSVNKTVGQYECIVCQKVFRYKSHLNLHLTIHTGEKPHICEICGQGYRIKRSLILHRRTHDELCRLKCEFCPKTYFDKKAFESHKLVHSGVKPYSCEICGKGFRRLLGFRNHQRLHRQDEAFKCDECDKTFVDKWGMLKHKTVHSGEKPHVCMQCGKMFRLKKGLYEHIKVHDKDLQIKCHLCPRTFIDQRKLDLHLMVHKGKKPFMCHKCGKGFMTPTSLKIHDRCHTGEKPYKCKFCDMTFNQQGSHIAHERHHKGERPYVCEICGDGFITKSQLTVHTRRHFNDRPYKCDECDYAAYTGSILRVHMVKHSNEKPFKCQLCPSAFKRQHHLDVHSKTHLTSVAAKSTIVNEVVDVVIFKCPYCSECFDSEDLLTGHIDTHEIVVVTETTANPNDDGFSNEGEPDEVAYNIVVL